MRLIGQSVSHRIAYFISPHGYGHAARASAVMAATYELDPAVRFEIFTQVPPWFFQDSLPGPFGYHSLLTDIGLVQKTPLAEDLPATLRRLDSFLPFDASQMKDLGRHVDQLQCQLIICDIAPMGIAVAREAGIPSVLVENFTWDWIYQGYVEYDARLSQHITYLRELFDVADYHVQTEPICRRFKADLTTPPVSRKVRTSAEQIRQQLGIPDQAKVVTITTGGIICQVTFLERLANQSNIYLIVPGADLRIQVRENSPARNGRVMLLPYHSDYYHPDLINASDAVVGKAGYSTVAEVYRAGVPFGYVPRPRFRESQVLAAFIENHMNGLAIAATQFHDDRWLSSVTDLLALPRIRHPDSCGADQVARFICELLEREN